MFNKFADGRDVIAARPIASYPSKTGGNAAPPSTVKECHELPCADAIKSEDGWFGPLTLAPRRHWASVGMVRLNALEVFDLITSSYLVGSLYRHRHTADTCFPERHGEVCGLRVSVVNPYILTRTQVVVGAVITRHPARQLRMRIGAADGIDFLYAGRVDSELHD